MALKHQHDIADHAKVYLDLNTATNEWVVAMSTCDGYPLDGIDDGPECDYRHDNAHDRDDQRECDDLISQAPSLPDAEDLIHLLADALGYTLTKKG